MSSTMRYLGLALVATLVASFAVLAEPAEGAVSTHNGLIAYTSSDWGVQSSAVGDTSPRFRLDIGGSYPAFSPDGMRVAFVSDGDIYASDVDGYERSLLDDVDGEPRDLDWSPDGAKLAFTLVPDGGTPLVAVTTIADGTTITLPLPDGAVGAQQPAWSPSGNKIAYAADGEIHVADADGSNATALLSDSTGGDTTPDWTPDGFAFARNGELWLANTDGTGAARFEGRDVGQITTIAVSPDGEWIAHDGVLQGFDVSHIHVARAAGGNVYSTVAPSGAGESYTQPAWQPVSEQTGPAAPSGVVATPGDRRITLGFTPPADADYRGVLVTKSNGGVPDRFVYRFVSFARGNGVNVTADLENGHPARFGVYSYDRLGNVSLAYGDVTATPRGPARVFFGVSRGEIVYPSSVGLTGSVQCGSVTDARVTIQRRLVGSSTWTTAATTYMNLQTKGFSTTYTPAASADLRAVWGPVGDCLQGTSAIQRVNVRQAIRLSPTKTRLRRGETFRTSGSLAPSAPGKWVWLQAFDGSKKVWRTVMSYKTTAKSEFWLSYRASGMRLMRVVYPTQGNATMWNMTAPFKVTWS